MKDSSVILEKFKKCPLVICDTTLRDGEQAAGIVFANLEKLRIAKLLDEIGVQQIEAGIPAMGGDEKKAIKKIAGLGLSASILGWNRANKEDIDHSIDCDVDSVAISMSSSDIHIQHKLMKSREWVLDKITEAVSYAKDHGLYISCNAEDASRADRDFLIKFALTAKEAGANRFRYCDTIGMQDPRRTYDDIKYIIENAKIEVEMHTHNDFGMATANAIAGIQAGARFASTTVLGIGERTGNSPLEEIAMAAKHILKMDVEFDTKRFREVSEYVARAAGRTIPGWKPIVGENCFAHEAGIHTDGVIKYLSNYEPYSPEEVGLSRKIIIGKHSGRHTLKQVLAKHGHEIDDNTSGILLEHVRASSVALKRSLSELELVYLYEDFKNGKLHHLKD
ncbi:MAG: homocitrate synthase [Methanomassiliicoccales archaeon]|nr:MAG: homocitrate synthase [Methanomassiliicoccales archaeon]